MAHIFWTFVNSITITTIDANMVIGGMVIIMFGWITVKVWQWIGGK